MLGLITMSTIRDVLDALINRDAKALLSLIDEIYKYGHDLIQLYKSIIENFRNLMVIKAGYEDIPVPKEEKEFLKELIKEISFEEIHRAISVLIRSETDMKFSSLPRITFETIMLRIISAPRLTDLKKLLDAPEETVKVFKQPEASRKIEPPKPLQVADEVKSWDGYKNLIKDNNPSLFRIISNCELSDETKGAIKICTSSEFNAEQLRRQQPEIKESLESYYNRNLNIQIEADINPSNRENQSKPAEIRTKALNDPVVKEIMAEFNGTIKDVR
jgi:DNA polymerase-3 subunit gamma/tau